MKDQITAKVYAAAKRLDRALRELDKEMIKTKHFFEYKRAVTEIGFRLNDISNLIYVAEQEEKK